MSNSANRSLGRVAGIDYGTRRIGIAIADLTVLIASPYENYERRGEAADRERFKRLAAEEQLSSFVVGLPVHLDGRESALSIEARRFGEWLQTATGIPVTYFDERFTSREAELHLADAKLTKKQRKARLDKIAAQIMLTGYLEKLVADRLTNKETQSPDAQIQGLDD